MKSKIKQTGNFVPRNRTDVTQSWGIFGRLDSVVFIVSAIICFGFILWGAADPGSLAVVLGQLLSATVSNWGWMYQAGVLFFVVFCFAVALSKYGKIKFGKDDDVPEYSNFSWFAMLFGAGMGVGLIYWSVAETVSHFLNGPVYAGASGSPQAAEWAMAISFLHWGISPWAIYVVVGIPMGLVIFRKGLPALVSSCFYPILGDRIYGPLGKLIDIVALCITFFGVSTTIGLGTMQLGAGLSFNYGIPLNNNLYIIILIVVAAAYLASACLPIDRGIKVGSDVSMIACLGLLLFLFILGPTKYIMDNFVNATGLYVQNFITMSTWTDPVGQTGWLNSWTIFYWAWWISWAPFVGMFIAKISKGRTIKQFVIAAIIAPSLFDMIFFDIFGSTALHFEFAEATKGLIQNAIASDVANGIYVLFDQFPFSDLITIIILFVVFTFFVVSADSATIVLGMLSSGGNDSPRISLKLLWGIALAFSAGLLIIMGGLTAVQTVPIVAVFPFIFILFALCYSTVKMLQQDHLFNEVTEISSGKNEEVLELEKIAQ
ncbi:MAG: BCCT family transporter [Firmicutes bacterium]|nr:BCCT family transporter [Bacillota bacterium]